VAQLFAMGCGEPREELLATPGQSQINLPSIHAAAPANRQPRRDEPVGESDGAVVSQLEPFGELAEGDLRASGKALDREEGLMLLGGKAGVLSGVFAKAQEPPQGIAKGRQRFEFRFREGDFLWHGRSAEPRRRVDVNANCQDDSVETPYQAGWNQRSEEAGRKGLGNPARAFPVE
jgi:hypothetical protein